MKILRFLLTAILGVFHFTGLLLAAGALHVYDAAQSLGLPLAPLRLAANPALGKLSGTLVLQRALEMVFQRFPSLNTFSMGFKEIDGVVVGAALDQDVVSRIHTPSTVSNFGTDAQSFAAQDVRGKLRNFRQVYHKFTPAEINSTDRRLIDEAAEPMAIGIAIEITKSVARQVSAANFGLTSNNQPSFVEVASSWSYSNTLNPLRTALNKRGVPETNRYFVANADVDGALLIDPLIIAAMNNPSNAEAIKRGELPDITSGLRYAPFSGLPSADGNLVGFAGSRDALLYIARAPKTPDEVYGDAARAAPFIYGIIIEPHTGFSVMVQQWIDTQLSCHTRLAWLDGLEVGNANNLVRLVKAGATGTAGQLVGLTVINPGYEYRNSGGTIAAPAVTISGGGGNGATATATVDSVGAVTGFTITAAGNGYTSPPTVTIAPQAGGSRAGEATAIATIGGVK